MLTHLVLGVLLGTAAPSAGASAPPSKLAATDSKAAPAKPAAKGATGAAVSETYAYLRDERTGAIRKVPLFSPEADTTAVAKIREEMITLRELSSALAASHMAGHAGPAHQKKREFGPVLDRLLSARLIVLEARETGIPELPEVKAEIADFRAETLRRIVKNRAVKDAKADPAEVEKLFNESSVEWQVRSVLVQKEDDAKKLAAAVKSGKSFDELAKQLVAEKKATGGTSEAVAPDKLRPEIAGAVRQLKIGAVTEPQKLSSDGFVLVKLEAVRHPEDAAKRQAAVDRALAVEKGLVLRRYYEGLVKQYAKKDDKLLAALDFEAEKPGFDALAKDTRPIVQIQGAAPITVADLAAAIQKKFFHGIEQAAKSKKINREKDDLLSFILAERLFDLEAARAKIADSPEYKTTVTEYTNSLVFGTFVQKVIIPNVKVSEPEIKKYFEQHKSDYTYPAFYKLDGIGFTRAADAQAAVAKLNKGTDLGWIRSNAEGQLNPDDQTLHFGGTVVSKALPKDLLPILATTKKGDYRLYSSEGQHYVVQVVEYTAPSVQKYEEARSDVGQKAYDEKIGRAIEEYAAKLKKAYKPKILITKLGN